MFMCLNTGAEQLYMRKHTVCCSLQTSTSNPYSKRTSQQTSQQTVPSSSTKGTRPVYSYFPTNNREHPHSWQQITDYRTQRQRPRPYVYTHVPDAGGWCTGEHSNAGTSAYLGGVVTSGVSIYTFNISGITCSTKQAQRLGMEAYQGVSSLTVKVLSSYCYVAPTSRVVCAGHVHTAV